MEITLSTVRSTFCIRPCFRTFVASIYLHAIYLFIFLLFRCWKFRHGCWHESTMFWIHQMHFGRILPDSEFIRMTSTHLFFFSRLNHFNVCVYQCMGLETYMIDLTHETYSSRMLRAAWKFHAYECVCVCVLSCAWKWHVSLPASLWLKLRGFFSFRKMIILPWFAIHILMISALIGIAIVFHGSATENQSTLNQSIIKTTRCQFPLMAFL